MVSKRHVKRSPSPLSYFLSRAMLLWYFSVARLSGMTEDIFDQTVEHATKEIVQVASFNDAAYGKLGIAKLTAEVSRTTPRGCECVGHATRYQQRRFLPKALRVIGSFNETLLMLLLWTSESGRLGAASIPKGKAQVPVLHASSIGIVSGDVCWVREPISRKWRTVCVGLFQIQLFYTRYPQGNATRVIKAQPETILSMIPHHYKLETPRMASRDRKYIDIGTGKSVG